eukprot:SAG31_NODE_1314_length_8851_cov_7.233318_2_plen_81_part_00
MFVGLALNFVFIWAYYHKSLSGFRKREDDDDDSSESPHRSTRLTPLAKRRAATSRKSKKIDAAFGPKLKKLSKKGSLTVC